MIDHVLRFTLPAAYDVLPPPMRSAGASALLLAIGAQESRGFAARRQDAGGPARGFWQFEASGIADVITRRSTGPVVAAALQALCYESAIGNVTYCLALVEDNDTLAAVFARLLLWTLPDPLPTRGQPDRGWKCYLDGWRPGRPRPATWAPYFADAWGRVMLGPDAPRLV